MQIDLGPYRLRLGLLPALLVGAGTLILAGLGTWQINRAVEKETLLAQFAHSAQAPRMALSPSHTTAESLHMRRATATGRLDLAHQFLLDNRTRAGRAGYEVLVPLRFADDGAAVLVNRGWLARGPARTVKPVPPLPGDVDGSTPVRASGLAVRPSRAFSLGAMREPGSDWPHIVQFVSLPAMRELLGYELLPVVLRLDAGDALALEAGWPLVSMPPERHYGYAVQWYGLALALLAVFAFAGLHKRRSAP